MGHTHTLHLVLYLHLIFNLQKALNPQIILVLESYLFHKVSFNLYHLDLI